MWDVEGGLFNQRTNEDRSSAALVRSGRPRGAEVATSASRGASVHVTRAKVLNAPERAFSQVDRLGDRLLELVGGVHSVGAATDSQV